MVSLFSSTCGLRSLMRHWIKKQRRRAEGEKGPYKIPRAFASASTRAISARRSESFLAIQLSQDFPVAVSSPVKAIVTIWSYRI